MRLLAQGRPRISDHLGVRARVGSLDDYVKHVYLTGHARGPAMSKKAFDKISEGLTEALAVARGELQPARLHIPAAAGLAKVASRPRA